MIKSLPLDLASTIRHDGVGGVADDLAEIAGLTAWVRDEVGLLGDWAAGFTADETSWAAVVELRRGVRALFAHAVRPAPPSRADAHRLLPLNEALDVVNTAAAQVPVTPRLDWSDDAPSVVMLVDEPDLTVALTAAIARATIDFLAGPQRCDLRACTAPRCVRYFIRGHGRQEFCKPSCSNRARVARHYDKHKNPAEAPLPLE